MCEPDSRAKIFMLCLGELRMGKYWLEIPNMVKIGKIDAGDIENNFELQDESLKRQSVHLESCWNLKKS